MTTVIPGHSLETFPAIQGDNSIAVVGGGIRMKLKRLQIAVLALLLGLLTGSAVWATSKKKSANSGLDDRQRALHALNRLTFGPRPGDVDRVLAIGVDKWIDQQLHPDKIDDSALEARLAPLRTLNMDTREIVTEFPPPQVVKAAENGRMSLPKDPAERAIYEAQMERMDAKNQANAQAAQPADENSMTDAQKAERRQELQFANAKFDDLMAMPADTRMTAILNMTPEERRKFDQGLRPVDRLKLAESVSPEQREQLMALRNPGQVVVTELQEGKILRAAYSERQLEEVMTDFWFNHFNVFIGKGPDLYLTTEYERNVIRPHAMGKFKDLLIATAKSPAMLWYLDNWDSVGPDSEFALNGGRRPPQNFRRMNGGFGRRPWWQTGQQRPRPTPQQKQQAQQRAPKGLNENYARELMELHTLGVDGGYSQKDVTEVAKVFTGWTIKQPQRGGGYEFDEIRHEPGPKFVLGKNIKANGEKEGIQVLEMLAHSPATAHFICKKLAIRFVSDDPPQSLVDSMAKTFLKSDGDITEVLRTMFHSREFWTADTYRAKVKTPLEFVVSAIRATDTDVTNALPLVQTLNRMGMPPYQQQPPTGYPMKAEAWVNSAALLNRMNFSLQLASGRMPGATFNPREILPVQFTSPEQAVASFENALLNGDVSKQTHDTILKQMEDPQLTGVALNRLDHPVRVNVIAGLILGSPEFQRR
jgi:uncharacterized protein (DUF1800 family)